MSGFSLDSSKWGEQRNKLAAMLQKKSAEVRERLEQAVRAAAATTAQVLANETFPKDGEIQAGRAAIARDIGKVFITAGEAYEMLRQDRGPRIAGAFYAAFKNGDHSAALQVLRESGSPLGRLEIGRVDPELHQSARGANGRVQISSPLRIVSSDDRKQYVDLVIQSLGEAASGWASGAEELGESGGVPRWKSPSVHGKHGYTRTESGPDRVTVVLGNSAPHARRLTSGADISKSVAAGKDRLIRELNG